MTKLAAGVDPLQVDLFQRFTRGVWEQRFSEGHDPLLNAGYGTLEYDEVVLHFTVSDKAAQSVKFS